MYQDDLRGLLFETYPVKLFFHLCPLLMECSKERCSLCHFWRVPGELFRRPQQRQKYHADVMKSSLSFFACALKNSTKVACSWIENSQLKLSFSSTQYSLGGWRRPIEQSVTMEPLQLKVQGHGVGLDIHKFLRKLE